MGDPNYDGHTLDDEGTRYQHYHELLDRWEEGLEIMNKYSYVNEVDKKKKEKLEAAVELLRTQIEVLANYGNNEIYALTEIDKLPKDPSAIKGGRGTALIKGYLK